MATSYVRKSGNDGNNGTSPATAKLTIQAGVGVATTAGDKCYVGAGVYREKVTTGHNGSVGSPIELIGDYTGEYTGDAGVVRITGSDDDITATRDQSINCTHNYRTFRNLKIDLTTTYGVLVYGGSNRIFENVYFGNSPGISIQIMNAATTDTIRRCVFDKGGTGYSTTAYITHSSTQDSAGHVIENCIFKNGYVGLGFARVAGCTVRNCTFTGFAYALNIVIALAAGQSNTVNNCIFANNGGRAIAAKAAGEIVENYNAFYGNVIDRENTDTGANSNTYPPLFDTRWFFELASKSQKLVSPFDLSADSQLINVAGTSPTTTDLRGQAVIGAQREWGALEYNSALSKAVGISRGRIV